MKKTSYNAEITEIESKIPSLDNLLNKTDYNPKITEIESKLFVENEF